MKQANPTYRDFLQLELINFHLSPLDLAKYSLLPDIDTYQHDGKVND